MPLTQVQAGMMDSTAQYYSFKNRIINGDMRIDQRNAGASVSASNGGQYFLDRWTCSISAGSKFTVQQSTTAPTGFKNSMLITSSTAWAVGASDYATINTYIEGFNAADLEWGTANANTITISFNVRSSVTGTFAGVITNQISASAATRSYPFTFTISAANVFESKTVTVPGDTSGTWGSSNAGGISLTISLAAGSSTTGTASAWAGSAYRGATGQTNLLATNGATFYITGVQLEKGSTATSFDYRPYGTELALCQRYLPVAIAPPFVVSSYFATGVNAGSISYPLYVFKVTPRVAPTGISVSSPADFGIYNGVASFTASGVTFNSASLDGSLLSVTGATLSNGTAVGMYFTNSNGKILFNGCEL